MKDIHDVIKHAKFGDDRIRGSGVVAGQISAFPIDFAGRPYNTLTLPCERVMYRLPFELTHSAKLLHFTILGGSADPPSPLPLNDAAAWGEVTSQSVWSQYGRHFVDVTRHNAFS